MRSLWLLLALVACGDFKTSTPTDGGASGDTSVPPGSTGVGPFGALPSGYCCTKNEDCRYRDCKQFGSVKMCSDPCDSNDGCNSAPGLACNMANMTCEPATALGCVPAEQWILGTKQLGDCCTATHDGHAGQECVGNRCVAFGPVTNPYICTQACSKPSDCPGAYFCSADAFCVPENTTSYTCK